MFHYVVVEPPLWKNNIVKVDIFSPKLHLKNQETSLKQPPLLQIYGIRVHIDMSIYIYVYIYIWVNFQKNKNTTPVQLVW